MITVADREIIRRAYFIEQKSIRQIARELHFSRKTIDKALVSADVQPYTLTAPRPAPKLGPFQHHIHTFMADNVRLPRKQRYTCHKMFELLQHMGYTGSESHVRAYVGHLRREQHRPAVYLPLEFDPGQDAQVDWGEAQAMIAGVQRTVQLFVMRLCSSRRVFAMAFPSQQQASFFAGHVHAFAHFQGVPHRLTYDNLTTAVKPVRHGRQRQEQDSFVVFRSHYLFESHFCTPAQGHEKGGVEHGVGFVRRNFMVPLPVVASFADLNAHLLRACLGDDQRVVAGHVRTIGTAWLAEQPSLRPLPTRPFDCSVLVPVRLTPYGQVLFETNRYSVPVEQAVCDLIVKAAPFEVEILAQHQIIARHPRCYERDQDIFDPLHYLALLEQRPGAFDHAKPIRRWREQWPPSYERLLARFRDQWPAGQGIREFVRVLDLHRHYPADQVALAVDFALEYGGRDAASVQACLQQGATPVVRPATLDLTDRPQLTAIGTQALDLHCYNRLLERI